MYRPVAAYTGARSSTSCCANCIDDYQYNGVQIVSLWYSWSGDDNAGMPFGSAMGCFSLATQQSGPACKVATGRRDTGMLLLQQLYG